MPVTKTARRALRVSLRKTKVNVQIISGMEIAIRKAKKSHKMVDALKAISLTDRAAKKNVIHKNKAARIKSALSKFVKTTKTSSTKKSTPKKTKK